MREKTTNWNFYRWTCSWFLSPLSSPVEGTTESFKIMLRYFHLPAIKRVWPLHLWIKVLILEFCSVNNLEFGQTPINTFWSWNLMSPTSLPSAALNSQFFVSTRNCSPCRTKKKNDNRSNYGLIATLEHSWPNRVSHQHLQFSWSHMVALIEQTSCQTWTQLPISDLYPRQLGYHVILYQLGPISTDSTKWHIAKSWILEWLCE